MFWFAASWRRTVLTVGITGYAYYVSYVGRYRQGCEAAVAADGCAVLWQDCGLVNGVGGRGRYGWRTSSKVYNFVQYNDRQPVTQRTTGRMRLKRQRASISHRVTLSARDQLDDRCRLEQPPTKVERIVHTPCESVSSPSWAKT